MIVVEAVEGGEGTTCTYFRLVSIGKISSKSSVASVIWCDFDWDITVEDCICI